LIFNYNIKNGDTGKLVSNPFLLLLLQYLVQTKD
jgi:hypothetical protein